MERDTHYLKAWHGEVKFWVARLELTWSQNYRTTALARCTKLVACSQTTKP